MSCNPPQLNLTMQELTRLALGGTQVTNVNIAILHSLLDMILKKLNCQNEMVTIGGYESRYLEKLLEHSRISPLAFNDENVELLVQKFEKCNELEERLLRLETKLEQHFAAIRSCNGLNNKKTDIDIDKWEQYENDCEDLCTICEPENEIACSLLKNVAFMRKLMRRCAKPIVDRMFDIEHRIEELHREFLEFLKRSEEHYNKIELIEKCIYEIQALRKRIDDEHNIFLKTMEEVQDMLDCKLDRAHMPALKKYIKDRFEKIEAVLIGLQETKSCPKAAGIVMGDLKCLSCGADKVCSEVGVYATGVLPDAHPGKVTEIANVEGIKKSVKGKCTCTGSLEPHEPTLAERIAKFKPGEELNMRKKDEKTCRLGDTRRTPELLIGFNGQIYRAA